MKSRTVVYFVLAFVIFMLDQGTKYLIVKNLNLYQVIKAMSHFNVVYYRNIGSAFGMFKGFGNPFFIFVSAAAIVAVSVMIIKDGDNRLGFSLILGGAAGNLTDRIAHGYVIDFLEVYVGNFYWPAFNVADSALTMGIVLIAIKSVWPRTQERRPL
jgi:signal peptidase II